MTEKYDVIFNEYKDYIEENSQYGARVVKYNNKTTSYFPLITLTQSNNVETDYSTIDGIEQYEEYYFTIEIYTKDKHIENEGVVPSQMINSELENLTIKFFSNKLNMKRTLNQPTPSFDEDILRRTIRYQCLIGNLRGNIIRR